MCWKFARHLLAFSYRKLPILFTRNPRTQTAMFDVAHPESPLEIQGGTPLKRSPASAAAPVALQIQRDMRVADFF